MGKELIYVYMMMLMIYVMGRCYCRRALVSHVTPTLGGSFKHFYDILHLRKMTAKKKKDESVLT